MKKPYLIDLHTHHDRPLDPTDQGFTIQTLHVTPELCADRLPKVCSIGLHPWFLEAGSWFQAWERLEQLAQSPQVIAIGECGLDRLATLPLDEQIKVFRKQITLAESMGKPLVIHCVRAFAELIAIKKAQRSPVAWIVHGFNKKADLLHQLLPHGFYFSYGAAIMRENSAAIASLQATPSDRLFLETDDQKDVAIEAIYARAAEIRQVTPEELTQQIKTNWEQLSQQS